MQRCASCTEADLGIILASNHSHELRHVVSVEVRRTKRMFCNHPSCWEDDEINSGLSNDFGRARQNREDRRIWMIIRDCVHRAEVFEVVFEWQIVAVPSNDIKRTTTNVLLVEFPAELVVHLDVSLHFLEASGRVLEISGVCQPVGSDRSQVRKAEVPLKAFQHVPPDLLLHLHPEDNAARDNTDLTLLHNNLSHLRPDGQSSSLRHNQHIPVGIVEGVGHRDVAGIQVDRHTFLCRRVSCSCYAPKALKERDALIGVHKRERIPSQLVWIPIKTVV
mmetsp:Transcript_3148/g.7590  ORF Transcript_3148/g.7590 Transcript_3148/m.7590 type:complete len:277 (+) Transcript_3148:377-1207(+)